MNFNETFRKDVDYDNIKSHENPGFTLSLEELVFKKPQRAGQVEPPQRLEG